MKSYFPGGLIEQERKHEETVSVLTDPELFDTLEKKDFSYVQGQQEMRLH